MKNKLHTTVCHPELSRSAASHPVCHSEGVTKLWSLSLSKCQILLFSILYSLFSIPLHSQTYNWDWAVSGGGPLGDYRDEQIHDIKVGTDNNYYFIASVYGKHGVQLDGQSVKTYNLSGSVAGGVEDIFLFSTTCDGTVRWSQAIGGAFDDTAYNLVLDSQNNVYIGAYVRNDDATSDGLPVHFSPTDSIPYPDLTNPQLPQEGFKTAYLVKYDSNGNYIDREALEGAVNAMEFLPPQLLDLAIDSKDNLHFIIGLRKGNGYLDNNINVPNTTAAFQYYLAKYDKDLDYVSSMLLPIPDGTGFAKGSTYFAYDENLNRYYVTGHRKNAPLTYDGSSVVNLSFLFAIDGTNGGLLWHRELYSNPIVGGPAIQSSNRFKSIKIDTNSDVYIGGDLFKNQNEQDLKIYDPNDPNVTPYLFTPGADFTLPMIFKINSNGVVQWVQATAAYSSGVLGPAPRQGKGIALKGSEVAFGVQSGADFWGTIEVVRPIINYQPDPVLVRFNKQTGAVINVHDIQGQAVSTKQMTAVATDNDGNYITAGTFNANLFMNNTLGITPLVSTGESDFFVAKLGAYACGTNSTEKFNNIKVNVYPNPTNDIINIETDETLLNYVVYDMNGREIQNGMFGSSNQLNLQNAANGVYFVKVTTVHNNVATVKVIKK